MEKISACIITLNEGKRIERCLEHLTWVDEIVVMDGKSNDDTITKIKAFAKKQKVNIKVYTKAFERFDEQKNAARAKCSNPWILDIDSDEIVSKELKEEILKITQQRPEENGFVIKREEYFLNKQILLTPLIRLYRKNKAVYKGRVHEILHVQGNIGTLKQRLIHESYLFQENQITIVLEKARIYANLGADKLLQGKEKEWSKLKVMFLLMFMPLKDTFGLLFYKGLITKGFPGIMWSVLSGYTAFLTIAMYCEKKYKKE